MNVVRKFSPSDLRQNRDAYTKALVEINGWHQRYNDRVVIRKARRDEAEAVAKVQVAALRQAFKPILPQDYVEKLQLESQQEIWDSILHDRDAGELILVADHPVDGVIGFSHSGISRRPGHDGELFAINVLPEHHYRRVAKRLVEATFKLMHTEGFRSVQATVLRDLPRRNVFAAWGGLCVAEETLEIMGSEKQLVVYSWPKIEDWTGFTLPVLETERFILRPVTMDDKQEFFDLYHDEDVHRWSHAPYHEDLTDTERYIERQVIGVYALGEPGPFAICFKDSPDKMIGVVKGFWVIKERHTMELAYSIRKEHWGKGIVVEAARTAIDYFFTNFALERLQCQCIVKNPQSLRVMEKLGFVYESVMRRTAFHRQQYWDSHMTSMLRHEWLNSKEDSVSAPQSR